MRQNKQSHELSSKPFLSHESLVRVVPDTKVSRKSHQSFMRLSQDSFERASYETPKEMLAHFHAFDHSHKTSLETSHETLMRVSIAKPRCSDVQNRKITKKRSLIRCLTKQSGSICFLHLVDLAHERSDVVRMIIS